MVCIPRFVFLLFTFSLALTHFGCATIYGLTESNGELSHVYRGTQIDATIIGNGGDNPENPAMALRILMVTATVIDIPFSVVLDTAVLPYTVFRDVIDWYRLTFTGD
jgi:uncharacterized protein YceK